MDGQDWKPINIGNPNNKTNTSHNKNSKNNQQNIDPKKQLEKNIEEGIFDKPQVDLNLKKMIQQARMAKKFSQKDLANNLKIKPEIIRDIENGKLIPNNMMIANLSRVLGVKLPRNKKNNK